MVDKVILGFLLAFSFVLAFGVFDPVLGGVAIVSLVKVLAVTLVVFSFIAYFDLIIHRFSKDVIYLLLIVFLLFFSSVIYGEAEHTKSIFNLELLICVVLYSILSFIFKRNPIYIHYSLLFFSVGVIVFTVLLNTIYSFGLQLSNGRLIVFGENPNSTSARFTIAVIYLFYFSIKNPFTIPLYRYLLLILTLPIMHLVIQSGSRGSLISMIIGCFMIIYFSDVKSIYKAVWTVIIILAFPFIMLVIADSGSMHERLVASFVEGDFAGRDYLWLATLEIFYNNPILGVGEPGYFVEMQKLAGRQYDAHNLVLYLLASGGVMTVSLFIVFYKNLVIKSFLFLKESDVLPLALLINITFIALKTGGVLTYSIMWFVFALVSAYPLEDKNPSRS